MSVSVSKCFTVKIGELYVSGLARGIRSMELSQFKQNAKTLDEKDVEWIKERVPTAVVYKVVTTVEETLVKDVEIDIERAEEPKETDETPKDYAVSV